MFKVSRKHYIKSLEIESAQRATRLSRLDKRGMYITYAGYIVVSDGGDLIGFIKRGKKWYAITLRLPEYVVGTSIEDCEKFFSDWVELGLCEEGGA